MQDHEIPGGDHHDPSPFNSVPPVVVAIFLLIIGVELALTFGAAGYIGGREAVGWRNDMAFQYGLNGRAFDMMVEQGRYDFDNLKRLVTYLFLHGSMTHGVFAGIMVLALGKMVGEAFGTFATLVLFFVPAIVGAIAWGLVLNDPRWLIGAFPGVYGLIGGFTFALWTRLGEEGAPQARAFMLIGFLLGIQLVFGALFGWGTDWFADLVAFVCGFFLSFVVTPGGWSKVRAKIRHD